MAVLKRFEIEQYRRRFNKGETLLEQGAASDGFFVLEVGRVQIVIDQVAIGRVEAIETVEFLGEIGALLRIPRTATVVADCFCDSLWVPTNELESVLRHNPDIGAALVRSLALKVIHSDEFLHDEFEMEKATERYLSGFAFLLERAAQTPHDQMADYLWNYFRQTNPLGIRRGRNEDLVLSMTPLPPIPIDGVHQTNEPPPQDIEHPPEDT